MTVVNTDASPAAGETVGERLRRLRLERGFSQRELAAPGVSYAYISRIEAGTRQPSVKALRRLAANLGVTADYLETGSDLDGSAVRELQLAQLELAVRLGERRGVHDALAAVLADSLAAGDNGAASRARVAIAQLALEDGRAQDAVDVLDEPSKGEPFLPGDRVETYVNLGRAYAAVGRTNEAAELFERCLAAVEAERADPALEARYATLLGSALSDTGDIARAEDAVRSALDRVEETGDPYLRVRHYWSAARHAQAEGRESAALSKVRRAVALLEATDDTFHLARAHLLAAETAIGRDDAATATTHVEHAERLLGGGAPPGEASEILRHRSRVALLRNEPAAAAAAAHEARARAPRPADQGRAAFALADALTALGDVADAHESYARAVELLEGSGQWRDASSASRAWGRMLRDHGREREALDVLDRAAELAVRATSEAGH